MSDTPHLSNLDASLNRAGEGLRVVEDYVRFVLDDPFLTAQAESAAARFRGARRRNPAADRHAARDTLRDVGTAISNAERGRREAMPGTCVPPV